MNDAPKPQQAGMINGQTAATLLMVSAQWIIQLTKNGWIEKQPGGQYRLVDVVQGYIKYLKDENRRSSKSESINKAADARRAEIELRTEERRQRLLREAQTEAIDIVSEYGGGLRADLLSIPPKLCPDMKQRAKFAEAIDLAFGAAARRTAAAANLVADARGRLETTGKNKPRRVGGKKPVVSDKRRGARAAKPRPNAIRKAVPPVL